MTYVLEMSTDKDILSTGVSGAFGDVTRYNWDAVSGGGLNIPAGSTIIVLAHGNNRVIGNKGPEITIDALGFVQLIVRNMAPNAVPGDIYISTCGNDVAAFAANVVFVLENNRMWNGNWVYGHNDAVAGTVPPPWPQDKDTWSSVKVVF